MDGTILTVLRDELITTCVELAFPLDRATRCELLAKLCRVCDSIVLTLDEQGDEDEELPGGRTVACQWAMDESQLKSNQCVGVAVE